MKNNNIDIQLKIIQPGGVEVFCVKTSFEKIRLKMINIYIESKEARGFRSFVGKKWKMKIDNLDIQDKIIQPGGVAVFCLKTSLASSSLIHQHGPPLPPASLFKLLRPKNSFRDKSICIWAFNICIVIQ